MPYIVYRTDPGGDKTVVACVDDPSEVGQVIIEDRAKIDWEPDYHVEEEDTWLKAT